MWGKVHARLTAIRGTGRQKSDPNRSQGRLRNRPDRLDTEPDGRDVRADRAQAVRLAPIGDAPASGFRMTSKHPAENRRDAGVRIPGSVLKASRGLIPNSVSL